MPEQLTPNENQQEDRARQAQSLAEKIEQQVGADNKVTLKGEAIEVSLRGSEFVITANGDTTFSLKDGPSHATADDILKHLASKT